MAGRTSDYLIVERRRQEDNRNKMRNQTEYFKHTLLKSQWEEATTRKLENNHILRKVEKLRGLQQASVDRRRQKLKELLESEKAAYIQELHDRPETLEQRQVEMQLRAAKLRAAREADREAIAREKLRQQWRENCNDIRHVASKEYEKEVWATREAQLQEKTARDRAASVENARWEALWEENYQAKVRRDERETAERQARNEETMRVLRDQLEELRQIRAREKALKEEQSRLLVEQIHIRQQEADREALQKHKERQERAREISFFNALAIKRRLKEEQDALALDLHILEETLSKEQDERMLNRERKAQLRKEATLYRQYLAEQKQWEAEQERRMDEIRSQEEEKLFRRQLEKYEADARARRELMAEVLRVRQQQIESKLVSKEGQIERQQAERDAVLAAIKETKEKEAADREHENAKQLEYKSHLEQQIAYRERLAERNTHLAQEEFALGQQAEEEYQRMLREESKRPRDFSKIRFNDNNLA